MGGVRLVQVIRKWQDLTRSAASALDRLAVTVPCVFIERTRCCKAHALPLKSSVVGLCPHLPGARQHFSPPDSSDVNKDLELKDQDNRQWRQSGLKTGGSWVPVPPLYCVKDLKSHPPRLLNPLHDHHFKIWGSRPPTPGLTPVGPGLANQEQGPIHFVPKDSLRTRTNKTARQHVRTGV
jgi:hypothetical protein